MKMSDRSAEELTRSLDEVLHAEKCYETKEGMVKRREVLKNLNVLVKQWIQVRQVVLKICSSADHPLPLSEREPLPRYALAVDRQGRGPHRHIWLLHAGNLTPGS